MTSLTAESPAAAAHDLHRRFWDGRLPVDPRGVAAGLAAQVVPLNDADRAKGLAGALHTAEAAQGAVVLVRVDDTAVPELQRFVVAYELGHLVLGHLNKVSVWRTTHASLRERADSEERVQATQFAAALLMPEAMVRQAVEREGITSVEALAQRFGVSHSAMRWQLVQLGIL